MIYLQRLRSYRCIISFKSHFMYRSFSYRVPHLFPEVYNLIKHVKMQDNHNPLLTSWLHMNSYEKYTAILSTTCATTASNLLIDCNIWLRDLTFDSNVRILDHCYSLDVREFSPKFPDLPRSVGDVLILRMDEATTPEICRAARLFSLLKIRHLDFFQLASETLVKKLENQTSAKSADHVISFLQSCGKVYFYSPDYFIPLSNFVKNSPETTSNDLLLRYAKMLQLASKFGLLQLLFFQDVSKKIEIELQNLMSDNNLNSKGNSALTVALCQIMLALSINPSTYHDKIMVKLVEFVSSPEVDQILRNHAPSLSIFEEQMRTIALSLMLDRPYLLLNQPAIDWRDYQISSSKLLSIPPLPNLSSNMHYQVLDSLAALLPHEKVLVESKIEQTAYVADIVIPMRGSPSWMGTDVSGNSMFMQQLHDKFGKGFKGVIFEVDGPSHFVILKDDRDRVLYHGKTRMKHRLLTKMGYKVLHVAYFDWPAQKHNREVAVNRLMQSALDDDVNVDLGEEYKMMFADILESEGKEINVREQAPF